MEIERQGKFKWVERKMKEIQAPDKIPWVEKTPVIYLAGSIEKGKAPHWRKIIKELLARKRVILLNPRRDDWDNSWVESIDNPQFFEQVSWELNAIEKADYVLFYFAPETQSPISLLELGLVAKQGNVIVCCPYGYWKRGNIEILCKKFRIPLVETLEEAIKFLPLKEEELNR